MSGKAEKLQDAIGLIKDEYIEEAHADAASDEKGSPSNLPAEGNAEGKVVKMPPQKRRRKPAVPIAIAACSRTCRSPSPKWPPSRRRR